MRNAVTKVKVSGSENKKGNKNTYISFKKRVTRKFLVILRCSRAKQLQRDVQKKSVLHLQSYFYAN